MEDFKKKPVAEVAFLSDWNWLMQELGDFCKWAMSIKIYAKGAKPTVTPTKNLPGNRQFFWPVLRLSL